MEGSEAPEGAERSDRTWECVKLELVWLLYVNDEKETVSAEPARNGWVRAEPASLSSEKFPRYLSNLFFDSSLIQQSGHLDFKIT